MKTRDEIKNHLLSMHFAGEHGSTERLPDDYVEKLADMIMYEFRPADNNPKVLTAAQEEKILEVVLNEKSRFLGAIKTVRNLLATTTSLRSLLASATDQIAKLGMVLAARDQTIDQQNKIIEGRRIAIEGYVTEVDRLNAELRKEKHEAESWQQEFNMYRSAWLREIGGVIRSKSHEIDGFVLRTRDIFEGFNDHKVLAPKYKAALALLNEHLNGHYADVEDAVRNLLQAYVTTKGNLETVEKQLTWQREELMLAARIMCEFKPGAALNSAAEDHADLWNLIAPLAQAKQNLTEALRCIIDIGKRDLSNTKYDGYFQHAREVLKIHAS